MNRRPKKRVRGEIVSAGEEHEDGEEVYEDAVAEQKSAEDEEMKEGPPEGHDPARPVRIYADGIYDVFHFGHARQLEQAKKLFPHVYLMAGVCGDAVTNTYKGKTVFTEQERYESLRHCKWVDEVVTDAPWVITPEFLEKHKVDYVAHDSAPYADTSGTGHNGDVYGWVKAAGKFLETKRTEGISTSELIMRILKDYNQYVVRNLARGFSRKDMNVSYLKEKQLRMNMGVTKLRQKVKEQQDRVGQKVRERVEKNREYLRKNVKEMRDNVGTVVKTVQHMGIVLTTEQRDQWVENADRWVSGFLEKFEESVHTMETVIHNSLLRPRLRRQPSRAKAGLSDKRSPSDDAGTTSDAGMTSGYSGECSEPSSESNDAHRGGAGGMGQDGSSDGAGNEDAAGGSGGTLKNGAGNVGEEHGMASGEGTVQAAA